MRHAVSIARIARPALLVPIVLLAFAVARGEDQQESAYGASPERDATGSNLLAEMRMAAALFDDFNIGGRLGIENAARRVPLAFFLDVEWRPYRRAVRVRESEMLEYQYREGRFTFGPGMTAAFPVLGDSVYLIAGGGAGLSLAWY